jgi:hypothetical protein
MLDAGQAFVQQVVDWISANALPSLRSAFGSLLSWDPRGRVQDD